MAEAQLGSGQRTGDEWSGAGELREGAGGSSFELVSPEKGARKRDCSLPGLWG